jgi:hypothetical protein
MQCPACGPEPSAVIFDGVTTMGDHHFETLQVFETSDFLTPSKSHRHGNFYIHEHILCK